MCDMHPPSFTRMELIETLHDLFHSGDIVAHCHDKARARRFAGALPLCYGLTPQGEHVGRG